MSSSLSMVEARLPAGFKFHPKDEELIWDYLLKKLTFCEEYFPLLIEVDLNKCEPWDIPQTACVGGKEWYFYSQRDRKYATGLRTNRATISGYWKATGKDRNILRKGTLVGKRKTLVFYKGRAPKGKKTDWVMHEFRLEGPLGPPQLPSAKEDWVLCRVFYKNGELADSKQSMESGYVDSLPSLIEPYITFEQTHQINNIYDQGQVSCFSPFSPNQINPTFPHITTDIDPNESTTSTHFFENIPDKKYIFSAQSFDLYSICGDILNIDWCLDHFSCDKKVTNSFLDNFTMLESDPNYMEGSPNFGEGCSELMDFPTKWTHC